MNRQSLVLADPDRELRDRLVRELTADGYAVICAPSEQSVPTALVNTRPALLVLGDFDEPGANARLIRSLRAGDLTGQSDRTPVLVLTDHADQLALLRCFDAGADDFVAKSVSYLELRARTRALIARSAGLRKSRQFRLGALAIDLDTQTAAWESRRFDLTVTEFKLLACLASDPNRLWTNDELLRQVWGFRSMPKTRTVDAHACRLRRKFNQAGADGWIVNRRGVGYRLVDLADLVAGGLPTG